MNEVGSESNPGEAPAPAKGFRVPGRVLVSRPFRAVGPRVFPQFHRAVSRLTRGRTLLDSAAQPMLMLITKGARTGQTRDTPLAAVPLEEGRLLVVGSNFAREQHPAWTVNLIANPDAEIMFRGERMSVRAPAPRRHRTRAAVADRGGLVSRLDRLHHRHRPRVPASSSWNRNSRRDRRAVIPPREKWEGAAKEPLWQSLPKHYARSS